MIRRVITWWHKDEIKVLNDCLEIMASIDTHLEEIEKIIQATYVVRGPEKYGNSYIATGHWND